MVPNFASPPSPRVTRIEPPSFKYSVMASNSCVVNFSRGPVITKMAASRSRSSVIGSLFMVSLKLAESLRRSTLSPVDRLKISWCATSKATVGRAMTVGRAAAAVALVALLCSRVYPRTRGRHTIGELHLWPIVRDPAEK